MNKSDLALIHGWGLGSGVWHTCAGQLESVARIHHVDLPGYGDTPDHGETFIEVAQTALEALPDGVTLCGWSLGGLVALHLAHRHPHKVRKLCLTASFAKFLAEPDYPEGLSNPALGKMITLFRQDYQKYMRQFLELQFLYAKAARPLLEQVLPDIVKHGTPAALETALNALSVADARALLPEIQQPVLLVYGDKDSITPPRMGDYLARHLPNAEMHTIPQAAHAPFLSHPAQFSALLHPFFAS
mgnify:CR=1 FL=1